MVNQYVLKYGRVRSCIRELFEYGKKQAAIVGPENVYDFSIGNPSVPPPEELKQAFIDVIQTESPLMVHGYTSAVGSDDARDAIAKALSERMGRTFTRRNFYITCGAAAALISSIKAFAVDHDSEAICFAPFFPEYSCFIDSAGMKQVIVPPDMDKFQINFPELEKALSPNTRCVIINSPNNPSGAILTRETLERLAKLLTEKSAEYGHTICFHHFREVETEFIKEVIANADKEYNAEGVKHKLVISHIAFTHICEPPFDIEQELYGEWARLMREHIKPELLLYGHHHVVDICPVGSDFDHQGQACTAIIGSRPTFANDKHPNGFIGAGIVLSDDGKKRVIFNNDKGEVLRDELID